MWQTKKEDPYEKEIEIFAYILLGLAVGLTGFFMDVLE